MSLFNSPDPPDPAAAVAQGAATAAAQQQYNTTAGQQSQAGSMTNQLNPLGSLTYTQTGVGPGGVPMWTSNLQLSPTQQALFDLLAGTKKTAGQAGSNLIAGANYGAAQPKDVIGGMTTGLTGELMAKQLEYYKPFFNMERDQLDTKLRNQGLAPGNLAYDNAMRQLDTNHGLVISKAASDFEAQAFDQASKLYGMPWQLGSAMAGFGAPGDVKSELVTTPQLNIQPANLIGATANAQDMLMKQYEAEQKKSSDSMSGLFGIPTAILGGWAKGGFPGLSGIGEALGGIGSGIAGLFGSGAGEAALGGMLAEFGPEMGLAAMGMFSDERVKEDIVPVGSLVDDTPVYSYRYKGDPTPRIGLMAQDVEKDTPEAVGEIGGIKVVNYAKATERSRNMVEALRRI